MHGSFSVVHGEDSVGELRLRRGASFLRLHHTGPVHSLPDETVIHGSLNDRVKVSCIDCIVTSSGSGTSNGNGNYHYTEVFPHYVALGSEHLRPCEPMIKAVHFSISDVDTVFYDFDAFGHVIDPKSLIEEVVAKNKIGRTVPVGEFPVIAYFTGKREVISVDTAIGHIAVNHRPGWSMGGPSGVQIMNKMTISIKPESPAVFEDCIDGILTLHRFLSLIAGRRQGVKSIQLELSNETNEHPVFLDLYWSLAPQATKGSGSKSADRPHPGDLPLNIIHGTESFATVMQNWIARDSGWRTARGQYSFCLEKGNEYNVARLVAAANMFDILPEAAGPTATKLPEEVAAAQSECLVILKRLVPGIERDSAINAIKRMPKPSLPKKVLHRTKVVQNYFGSRLLELDLVAKTAVQCRNYFVHGGSSDFDFTAVEPLISFLTDTLEFIFGSSDLIDAGWDGGAWNAEMHGQGHPFARFKSQYDESLGALKLALGK